MWWVYGLFTLMVIAPGCRSASLPTKTPYRPAYPDYGPGPDYYIPFSVPGQIFEGIAIADILQGVGDFVNGDNIISGASEACRRLGPAIGDLLSDSGSHVSIGQICEYFEAVDVEEECGKLWNQKVSSACREDLIDGSQSILPGFQCWDRGGDCYEGYSSYHGDLNYTFPDYGFPSIFERQLDTVSPDDLNPYDPCSESGAEKVNNIVFALMDWLGPSLFSSAYSYNSNDLPYTVCGLMRYILSMDVDDFIDNVIGILKFPVADILEVIQPLNICALRSEPGAEPVGIVIDLLVAFSNLNEDQFCDFITEEQTREAYLEQGQILVSNVIFLIHDQQRCENVLSIIAPLDNFGYFYMITGFNVSTDTERQEFCEVLVDAYSPTSSYVPTPYELPPGVDLEDIEPFETPGEFLPGLTFVDLLRIEGAELNSEKVVDSLAVTCTVFEDLIASVVDVQEFDVRGFCTGVRHRALGIMEDFCLAAAVPAPHNNDLPIGLRPFNPAPVLIYAAHEISGIDDVSRKEICPAVDDLLTDQSFIDLLSQVTDIFLTEALPSIHGLCQNWDEARCYLKPYCPVPEQPTDASTVTESPFYYRPWVPSPEYIEERNAEFDRIFNGLASIAWLIAGFDGRQETCAFVAEAIDPLSGRGERPSAEVARNQILGFFVDVGRCSQAVDIALSLIAEEDLEQLLTQGNTNIVYQITGYDSSRDFCQAVAEAFGGGGPPASEAPGQKVANIKVIADIAVYIQRAARSIRSL